MAKSERRKKGEGSIVKRGEKFYAELKYNNPLTNEKICKRGVLRATKKEAESDLKKLKEERDALMESQNYNTQNMSVKDYYTKVFLPYKKEIVKGQTYKRDESTIMTHIIPYLGMKPLKNLTSIDIQNRINQMSKTASYSGTIKLYNAFNSMFTFAEANGDIAQNPMKRVPRPREDKFKKQEQKWLKPDEVERFAKAATRLNYKGEPLYKYGHFYLFMLNCGIREGEAAALLKSDIDFKKRTLNITKSLNIIKKDDQTAERGYIYAIDISTPKNANSVRIVPLNDEAITYATLIMEEFPEGDKFIYTSTGEYVRPDILIKQFQKILQKAQIEKMGLHALRHTFVSVLFENNIDIYTIASLIGDEVSTVQRTYLHLYKERRVRAVEATNIIAAATAFSEKEYIKKDSNP